MLFAGVVDSTSDAEDLDAEARMRASAQYLDAMRAVFERHGGTVEAYPGDLLMAVFGVPLLHDDDAPRAVRAAVEMREVLAGLGDELRAVIRGPAERSRGDRDRRGDRRPSALPDGRSRAETP